MKENLANIQIASDLHLEFIANEFSGELLLRVVKEVGALVLAGDIANGATALSLFSEIAKKVPVIYVAGNHEFYGHSIETVCAEMRDASRKYGIHYLENSAVEIGGVRFLGCTLWTDYKLSDSSDQLQSMRIAEGALADHRLIRTGGGRFSAKDALSLHIQSRTWLIWTNHSRGKRWSLHTMVHTGIPLLHDSQAIRSILDSLVTSQT